MARALRRGRSPSRALARAAAILMRTVASTKAGWARRPEMGKFSTARAVWAPQSAPAGTRTSPIVSFSIRVLGPLLRRAMGDSVSADDQPDRGFEHEAQ